MQVGKARRARSERSQDERGPPLAEHFRGFGDGTELVVAAHLPAFIPVRTVRATSKTGVARRRHRWSDGHSEETLSAMTNTGTMLEHNRAAAAAWDAGG